MRASRVVAVNERGRRIGESHHNSVLSDDLVDRMRSRHEDDGLGYRKIAAEFGLSLSTVTKICSYQRRAQTAERWKTVKVRKEKPSPDRSDGYRPYRATLWSLVASTNASSTNAA